MKYTIKPLEWNDFSDTKAYTSAMGFHYAVWKQRGRFLWEEAEDVEPTPAITTNPSKKRSDLWIEKIGEF